MQGGAPVQQVAAQHQLRVPVQQDLEPAIVAAAGGGVDIDGTCGLVGPAVMKKQLRHACVAGGLCLVPGRPGLRMGAGAGVGQAAATEQKLGHVALAGAGRDMERRSTALAPGVGVGRVVQQQTGDLLMAAASGFVQGRVAGVVHWRRPGVVGEQGAGGLQMPAAGRRMQRRGTAIVLGVGRRARPQQKLDHFGMTFGRRQVQRRDLGLLAARHPVGVLRQDRADRVGVAGSGRLVQIVHQLPASSWLLCKRLGRRKRCVGLTGAPPEVVHSSASIKPFRGRRT